MQPSTVYQIFVFGNTDLAAGAENVVTITGGQWMGSTQTYNFTQVVARNSLVVNDHLPTSDELSTLPLYVISDATGKIKISVTNSPGKQIGLSGLAIAPTKVGSISGQKWNDLDGDKTKDATEPGLEGWVIYIDENSNGVLDTNTIPGEPGGTFTVESTNVQDIPDQDPAGVKSTLQFTHVGNITDISVKLNITHPFDSDLTVRLISPSGQEVTLYEAEGDTGGTNFANTVFSDHAEHSIPSNGAGSPYTGTFRPKEALLHRKLADGTLVNNLLGAAANGIWTLEVKDDTTGDFGTLDGWSLTIELESTPDTIELAETHTETDANGNYSFSDLPPGLYTIREYITPQQAADGWRQTKAPTPITVSSGANVTGHDFGNRQFSTSELPNSISGHNYYDTESGRCERQWRIRYSRVGRLHRCQWQRNSRCIAFDSDRRIDGCASRYSGSQDDKFTHHGWRLRECHQCRSHARHHA